MNNLQVGAIVALFCVTIATTGCQQDQVPAKTANRTETGNSNRTKQGQVDARRDNQVTQAVANNGRNAGERAEKQASAVTPIAPAKLEPSEMPRLALSDAHASLCLAKVGDALPDAELVNLDGQTQQLSTLLGKKLTVVAFWTASDRYSLEELEDLSRMVAAPYSGYGVNVVGVNTADSSDVARELSEKRDVVFPIVLDDGGKLLAQVSSGRLPRTYLLDADGKILWLDLEYSRTTRRDLLSAIRSQLASQ
jgi:peroxiredoxin